MPVLLHDTKRAFDNPRSLHAPSLEGSVVFSPATADFYFLQKAIQ